jgi:hypothetical protein
MPRSRSGAARGVPPAPSSSSANRSCILARSDRPQPHSRPHRSRARSSCGAHWSMSPMRRKPTQPPTGHESSAHPGGGAAGRVYAPGATVLPELSPLSQGGGRPMASPPPAIAVIHWLSLACSRSFLSLVLSCGRVIPRCDQSPPAGEDTSERYRPWPRNRLRSRSRMHSSMPTGRG